MYICKTARDFKKYFIAEVMPDIRKQESQYIAGRCSVDLPLRRETWNNLIDSLVRDRQLPKRAIDWCCPW